MASTPPGDELPGERIIATYRGGLLRLTDRRVVYQGRGLSSRLCASLSLSDVTAAGIGRRSAFTLTRLSIPLGLVIFGFLMAYVIISPEPFMWGILLAVASLPFALSAGRPMIQIGAGGYLLQVPVSLAHHEEARSFLTQLDALRFSTDTKEGGVGAASAPSTRLYGAGSGPGVSASETPQRA